VETILISGKTDEILKASFLPSTTMTWGLMLSGRKT
jgi:hypothetical protein